MPFVGCRINDKNYNDNLKLFNKNWSFNEILRFAVSKPSPSQSNSMSYSFDFSMCTVDDKIV